MKDVLGRGWLLPLLGQLRLGSEGHQVVGQQTLVEQGEAAYRELQLCGGVEAGTHRVVAAGEAACKGKPAAALGLLAALTTSTRLIARPRWFALAAAAESQRRRQ